MQLYQIQNNGNKYCGPSAISAIAGIGAKEAAAIIRARFGQRTVRGTHPTHVRHALEQLGFGMLMMPAPTKRPTLRQWAKDNARGKDVWLIDAGNHWVLVQGRYAMCGKTKDLVHVADHPNARSFVREVYRISKLRNVDPASVIPTKPMHEINEAAAKRKAKSLAARHGIEIEQFNDETSIWVYPPAGIPPKDDPYDDEHFVDYWVDALERVKKYIAVKEELGRRPQRSNQLGKELMQELVGSTEASGAPAPQMSAKKRCAKNKASR